MTKDKNTTVDTMFKSGFHFGVARSRRHPSTKQYIFGVKNKTEIFDLEKSEVALLAALEFIKKVAASGKQILFVTGKSEAKESLRSVAKNFISRSLPVAGSEARLPILRKSESASTNSNRAKRKRKKASSRNTRRKKDF